MGSQNIVGLYSLFSLMYGLRKQMRSTVEVYGKKWKRLKKKKKWWYSHFLIFPYLFAHFMKNRDKIQQKGCRLLLLHNADWYSFYCGEFKCWPLNASDTGSSISMWGFATMVATRQYVIFSNKDGARAESGFRLRSRGGPPLAERTRCHMSIK